MNRDEIVIKSIETVIHFLMNRKSWLCEFKHKRLSNHRTGMDGEINKVRSVVKYLQGIKEEIVKGRGY